MRNTKAIAVNARTYVLFNSRGEWRRPWMAAGEPSSY
jgi:hypothetical protein